MKLIDPITMTQSKIAYYNVTQDTAIWSSTATYAKGDRVIVDGCGCMVYESLINSNTNQPPATTLGVAWLKVGASNFAAMFDSVNGTKTKRTDNIQLNVQTSEMINAIGFIGVNAKEIRIVMTDTLYGNGIVYDKTITLKKLKALNWFQFIFGRFMQETVAVFDDLPPFRSSTIAITVTAYETGGQAEVGTIQLGRLETIGDSELGFTNDFIDYSSKTVDAFGNYDITKRANAKTLDAKVSVDTSKLPFIERLREKLATKPIIWIGSKKHSITVGFGFFDQFSLDLSNEIKSRVNIRVITLT
jgi:hypothetical protein